MIYNERMQRLRLCFQISEEGISREMGISQSSYSAYEKGSTRMPLDMLLRLAAYYNCSIDYISGASDIPAPYPER